MNEQELDLLKITQLQALEIVIHIMKMFNFNTKNRQINEKTAKAFINSVFGSAIISWK